MPLLLVQPPTSTSASSRTAASGSSSSSAAAVDNRSNNSSTFFPPHRVGELQGEEESCTMAPAVPTVSGGTLSSFSVSDREEHSSHVLPRPPLRAGRAQPPIAPLTRDSVRGLFEVSVPHTCVSNESSTQLGSPTDTSAEAQFVSALKLFCQPVSSSSMCDVSEFQSASTFSQPHQQQRQSSSFRSPRHSLGSSLPGATLSPSPPKQQQHHHHQAPYSSSSVVSLGGRSGSITAPMVRTEEEPPSNTALPPPPSVTTTPPLSDGLLATSTSSRRPPTATWLPQMFTQVKEGGGGGDHSQPQHAATLASIFATNDGPSVSASDAGLHHHHQQYHLLPSSNSGNGGGAAALLLRSSHWSPIPSPVPSGVTPLVPTTTTIPTIRSSSTSPRGSLPSGGGDEYFLSVQSQQRGSQPYFPSPLSSPNHRRGGSGGFHQQNIPPPPSTTTPTTMTMWIGGPRPVTAVVSKASLPSSRLTTTVTGSSYLGLTDLLSLNNTTTSSLLASFDQLYGSGIYARPSLAASGNPPPPLSSPPSPTPPPPPSGSGRGGSSMGMSGRNRSSMSPDQHSHQPPHHHHHNNNNNSAANNPSWSLLQSSRIMQSSCHHHHRPSMSLPSASTLPLREHLTLVATTIDAVTTGAAHECGTEEKELDRVDEKNHHRRASSPHQQRRSVAEERRASPSSTAATPMANSPPQPRPFPGTTTLSFPPPARAWPTTEGHRRSRTNCSSHRHPS